MHKQLIKTPTSFVLTEENFCLVVQHSFKEASLYHVINSHLEQVLKNIFIAKMLLSEP